MKKLILGSAALLFFAIAMSLFQMSCQKDAEAINANSTVQNKFLYAYGPYGGNSNVQYWITNTDGTNQQLINITLPAGQTLGYSCKLTADAQKIIFDAYGGNYKHYIYSASINGTNVTLLRELTAWQVDINDTF